jgi:SOS regulatory protein LexA
MISDIMTLQEVADYLKVNKQTIYRMLNANQIPAFRVRSEWRFKKEEIDKWIEQGTPEGDYREQDKSDANLLEIPIVGRIAAGTPILAEENIEGTISVKKNSVINPDNVFALKIQGESMINANINDGDTVLIRQQPTAENGEIIAVIIDGEATLKRFYKEGDKIRLQPENDKMKPIIVNPEEKNISIAGKVERVIKKNISSSKIVITTKEKLI